VVRQFVLGVEVHPARNEPGTMRDTPEKDLQAGVVMVQVGVVSRLSPRTVT